jgi:hypothetical protein
MLGDLPLEGTSFTFGLITDENYPTIVGFSGIKISKDDEDYFLGTARWVKIHVN